MLSKEFAGAGADKRLISIQLNKQGTLSSAYMSTLTASAALFLSLSLSLSLSFTLSHTHTLVFDL